MLSSLWRLQWQDAVGRDVGPSSPGGWHSGGLHYPRCSWSSPLALVPGTLRSALTVWCSEQGCQGNLPEHGGHAYTSQPHCPTVVLATWGDKLTEVPATLWPHGDAGAVDNLPVNREEPVQWVRADLGVGEVRAGKRAETSQAFGHRPVPMPFGVHLFPFSFCLLFLSV